MKHKSPLFLLIGGVATVVTFASTGAAPTAALAPPGDQVCTAPITTAVARPTTTAGVAGLRSSQRVNPQADSVKYVYKVTLRVTLVDHIDYTVTMLDNNCKFANDAFTLIRLPGFWSVTFPKKEITGKDCFVEVLIDGVKTQEIELGNPDKEYSFAFDHPKKATFKVGFVINCF